MSTAHSAQVSAAIQNLLYRDPLYHWIPEGGQGIRVAAVGYDSYVETFIDLCLQAGQMKDHPLFITVFSGDPAAAQKHYLSRRPALRDFVHVDGSLQGREFKSYPTLDFQALPGLEQLSAGAAKYILCPSPSQKQVHYVLISLGDDKSGRVFAEHLCRAAEEQDNRCCVNYVVTSAPPSGPQNGRCRPVLADSGPRRVDEELERLAFNVHLSWSGMKNIDLEKAWTEFHEPYYYDSSISYALSIPYKLWSFGITGKDAADQAQRFDQEILRSRRADKKADKKTGAAFREIAALEHRRWVMEKVTDGWTAPPQKNGKTDYSYCRAGSVKGDKIHPCIVRSTPDTPLKSKSYTKNGHEKWDPPASGADDTRELEKLDELDRMSIELHRTFYQWAAEFRKTDPMGNDDAPVSKIRAILSASAPNGEDREDGGSEAPAEDQQFRRFCLCLRNILDGDSGYSAQYDAYAQAFSDAVSASPRITGPDKEEIGRQLIRLKSDFFPTVERNLYRDYKELDEILILHIPFILTYSRSRHLAVVLDLAEEKNGGSDVVFRNVASATVLYPSKITYLYAVGSRPNWGLLSRELTIISDYFRRRQIHCRLGLCAVLPAWDRSLKKAEKQWDECNRTLDELSGSIGLEWTLLKCADEENAADQILLALQEQGAELLDGTNALFPSNRQNSLFVRRAAEELPYFEFDFVRQRFLNDSGCPYLHYMDQTAYLRIEDMFALMNAADRRFHYQDFAGEYETLWKIYDGTHTGKTFKKAVSRWNDLCDVLAGYHQQFHTGEDDLEVAGLSLDSIKSHWRRDECRGLLRALNGQRLDHYGNWRKRQEPAFITDLEETENGGISFRYRSGKFKRLLTKAGEMLEIHTYFQACGTGYFDDVASGYEFRWEARDLSGESTGGAEESGRARAVVNELDCVMTKGFRSIIVECKSQADLRQDFFYKLDSLASRFGVGTKRVLVVTNHRLDPDAEREKNNDMQKDRSRLMGIYTIWKEEDIRHIGQKLKDIMDGAAEL